ncbi:alpha/beta hydrolase [uncultured Algibacter sp.]|uniref:alpha/beta hydrolase n=1 Tax=uncultured Algibacter sp. TaxID=298659 RepID=UPI00262555C3|nr:alpha/beta hydrolase [uncultured Algibacter sp.]
MEIDTSYTIHNTFQKEIKKFPNISIAYANSIINLSETKDLIFKELNNQKLHLDFYRVKNNELVPAVILIHGGGWKSGNKSHMEPLAKSIASQGYACFAVEYRLSAQAIYPAGINDVKHAIKFIRANATKFGVDSTKIAVLGCSSGGQMAALIGTKNNEDYSSTKVQAIINIDGILAFKHPQSRENVVASKWLGGTCKEKPKVWEEASALNHTNAQTPPILFINSQYDRFHAGRDDMIKILKKHNIYYNLKTILNSPHTFWLFNPYFKETTKHIVTFLDNQFKPN